MGLASDFKNYCRDIEFNLSDEMQTTIHNITKKLNSEYYDMPKEEKKHMYIVGSVGRKTAVKGSSDLDLIFDMPDSIFKRFDNYESNGQSELLQHVKKRLQQRYPQTNIRGDGQVVCIEFSKYTIELVPGFKQSDERFKYPDTHDGGSWEFTDPLSEQEECDSSSKKTNGAFIDFCHIIRKWRNHIGFKLGGLLIDTFVFNHFKEEEFSGNFKYSNYLNILKDVLGYIASLDQEQSFWFALGSNQKVYNKNYDKFATKAQKALDKLNKAEDNGEDINDTLRELLGSDFPKSDDSRTTNISSDIYYNDTEVFIEKKVPVDIRYSLRIDCKVSQDGFRDIYLRKSSDKYIGLKKDLRFFIEYTDCPNGYDIYWKVRNVGEDAIKRDCIRGQIVKGTDVKKEHSDFCGPHYVECYLVKNGVCVARDRINVPINLKRIDRFFVF